MWTMLAGSDLIWFLATVASKQMFPHVADLVEAVMFARGDKLDRVVMWCSSPIRLGTLAM